jgi:hypothetical protein
MSESLKLETSIWDRRLSIAEIERVKLDLTERCFPAHS